MPYDSKQTYATGMRTDCRRDNRQTICPNATMIGFATRKAKRGSWIMYQVDDRYHTARVIGRVHCEGKTYLEVMALSQCMTMCFVRWINPCEVLECYATPPRQVLAFMLGEWASEREIINRAAYGFSSAPEQNGGVEA